MTTASAPTPTRDRAVAGWWPSRGDQRAAASPSEPVFLTLTRALDRLAGQRTWRRLMLGAAEFGMALLAAAAAVLIVYGSHPRQRWADVAGPAVLLIGAKIVAGLFTGAFGSRWRYVGMRDALAVLRSTVLAATAGFAGIAWFDPVPEGLRFVVADAALYLLLSGGLRLSARWLHQRERRASAVTGNRLRRTVIVGAGEAGALLLERILTSPKMLMDPIALVDDDANMHGSRLHGVPILGPVRELGAIAERLGADETIIAVPSASTEQMARIVDSCVGTGLPFRIAPDPDDMLGTRPGASGLRDPRPSDLLGRPQAEFDVARVRAELRHARVVITGAAGSIGSELARQIIKHEPEALYLVDRNENDLHYLCEEFGRHQIQLPVRGIIEDVREQSRLSWLLKDLRATHVFHAAAFKHVPLMESHAVAAVDNNILGTWSALQAASAAGVRKFVLISSDKAVQPRNVMGATKRFAEVLVAEATHGSTMDGIIVRFGNVLGSNGSVVPLFQRQISEGGPVTVTSRKATRYFMTPSEAAQLVLQAAGMPECAGNIAILDMGTPVRIWDLAERMIRMSGLRPGADISIVETGLRPGEKLHEELWSGSEDAAPSSNPRIMLAEIRCLTHQATSLLPLVRQLVNLGDPTALLDLLARSVGLTNHAGVASHGSPGRDGRTRRAASVA